MGLVDSINQFNKRDAADEQAVQEVMRLHDDLVADAQMFHHLTPTPEGRAALEAAVRALATR